MQLFRNSIEGVRDKMKKILFIFIILILAFKVYSAQENKEMIENSNLKLASNAENKIPLPNQKIFLYSKPEGGIIIGNAISKEEIEQQIGKMTEEEYINHILGEDTLTAIRFRFINQEDYPQDNYFGIEAWCDVTPDSRIDIDCTKAKEIEMKIMREKRQKEFEEFGFPVRLHPELEKSLLSDETKKNLQELRDKTEPLKSLETKGKYNDEALLNEIKRLGSL